MRKSPLAAPSSSLLKEISNTANGKSARPEKQASVLELVRQLELDSPAPDNLLTVQQELILGKWYLQYTSPSDIEDATVSNKWKPENAKEGDANIETKPFSAQGSVSAAGIKVDTSNRVVTQTITPDGRVENDIVTDWGRIFVAGTFRQSPSVPTRAVVAFDTAQITYSGITFDLGFAFTLLEIIRGTKDNGWLETTYINKDTRIGRGNKGTMFVLTREADAVAP